jgi:hypothetical protein
VEVLALNLTFECGLSIRFHSIRDTDATLGSETRMLVDHCRMGSDIQNLVNEVFHSKNRFYLQAKLHDEQTLPYLRLSPHGVPGSTHKSEPDTAVHYPHISKRSLIRRVVLGVQAVEVSWMHVAKLAQVLSNLKHVTVWLHDARDDMRRFPVNCGDFIKTVGDGTTFACQGA